MILLFLLWCFFVIIGVAILLGLIGVVIFLCLPKTGSTSAVSGRM